MSIKELMTVEKFEYKGLCHCDGHETHRWKKGDTEIRWRKYKGQVQVYEGRTIKRSWFPVAEFEKYVLETKETTGLLN